MAFPGLVWYVCVTILGGKRKWGDLAYTRARCLPTPFATREAPHVVLPLCRKPMERIPRRRPMTRRRGRVRAFPSEAISSTERPESLCRRAPPTSIASQLVALRTLRHAKFLSIGACKNPRVIPAPRMLRIEAFGCQRPRPQRVCMCGRCRQTLVRGPRSRSGRAAEVG